SQKKFLAYASRSKVTPQVFDDLLNAHLKKDTLSTPAGRLRMVGRCGKYKMQTTGKSIWGAKCTSRFEEYVEVWPEACFINMLRDGRDVLASQLNTGSFNPNPTQLGASWAKQHLRFQKLAQEGVIQGLTVRYENLVSDPEPEIRAICAF